MVPTLKVASLSRLYVFEETAHKLMAKRFQIISRLRYKIQFCEIFVIYIVNSILLQYYYFVKSVWVIEASI